MITKTLYVYVILDTETGKKRTIKTLEELPKYGMPGLEYRLIADLGKVLTDGIITTSCIDTDNPALWTEIDEPQPEPEGESND